MSLKSAFKISTIMLSALVISLGAAQALAQDAIVIQDTVAPVDSAPPPVVAATTDFLPVKTAEEAGITIAEDNPTHPAIKLTPDRSELVRLETNASAVIVGNPAHVSIMPEGANLLVLVPKAPGATYFTVLDENSKVIMQRHVIVAAPKEKYVRIRKACGGADDCQNTQVYYCPDMCHEIILNADGTGGGSSEKKSVGEEIDEAIDAVENIDKDKGEESGNAAAEDTSAGTTEE